MSRPPDVGEVLTPVLARIPRERQPLLVAVAERLAAERYRRWAGQPELADDAGRLRDCALREETIAAKVEALFRDVDALTREILSEVPELEALNRELFDGRPLREQLAIQARGEHLGADTWRAFARQANGAERQAFEACAPLEEESAAVLERILRRS